MKEIKNKNKIMLYVELKGGDKLENLLHQKYIEEEKSIRQIANELDIHHHTVRKWLQLASIDLRIAHQKMLEVMEIKRRLERLNKK